MSANIKQHLILDDVSGTGEYGLIQKQVAKHRILFVAHQTKDMGNVPLLRHQIRFLIQVLQVIVFDEPHRAAVKIDNAISEGQFKARRPVRPRFVDPVTSEHQEMRLGHEAKGGSAFAFEVKEEVLPPGVDPCELASSEKIFRLFGIAVDANHAPIQKSTEFLLEDEQGWPFHNAPISC